MYYIVPSILWCGVRKGKTPRKNHMRGYSPLASLKHEANLQLKLPIIPSRHSARISCNKRNQHWEVPGTFLEAKIL